MGLSPVPFHYPSPLHTLKIGDISVKLNRMQCCSQAKCFCLMKTEMLM